MKLSYYILAAIFAVLFLLGISNPANAGWLDPKPRTSDQNVAAQMERLMKQADQAVGLPGIVNFFEKRMVRMLYELRDDPEYRTHSCITTLDGRFIKICDSIGFGINASIQYSNPVKLYEGSGMDGRAATFTPQAEPNGLFMPEGLAATYVMRFDAEKNDIAPVYVEQEVIVSPFPLGGGQ